MAFESNLVELYQKIGDVESAAERLDLDLVYDDGMIMLIEPPRRSNFRATVKGRQINEPCFLELEPYEEVGLDPQTSVCLHMPEGTSHEDAKRAAEVLNDLCLSLKIERF